jgi:hypothetical protein
MNNFKLKSCTRNNFDVSQNLYNDKAIKSAFKNAVDHQLIPYRQSGYQINYLVHFNDILDDFIQINDILFDKIKINYSVCDNQYTIANKKLLRDWITYHKERFQIYLVSRKENLILWSLYNR